MGAFDNGFSMGKGIVNDALDRAQKEKEYAMAKEAHDQRQEMGALAIADTRRTQGIHRATDEAGAEYKTMLNNGVYAGGNTSGLSDGSAQMLFGQGGQKAVDETASYANAENRRFGLNVPDYTTSTAAVPAGQGLPASVAVPTVQSRVATDRDRLQGRTNIALASNDYGALAGLANEGRLLDKRDITNRVAAMSKAEIIEKAGEVNLAGNIPMNYLGAGKGGYTFMTTDPKGAPGKQFTVSEVQLRQMVLGGALSSGGFGDEGMSALAGAHKEIDNRITAHNASNHEIAKTNNDAMHKGNTDANGRITANAHAANASHTRRSPMNFVDAKGELVMVDTSTLPVVNGVYQTPPGLRQVKPVGVLNDQQKLAYAAATKEISGMDAGGDVAGIYAKYGLNPKDFGVSDPVADMAKAITAKMAEDKKKAGGLPAPQAQPQRQITTIVPPRSASDMKPPIVATDNELAIRYLGMGMGK